MAEEEEMGICGIGNATGGNIDKGEPSDSTVKVLCLQPKPCQTCKQGQHCKRCQGQQVCLVDKGNEQAQKDNTYIDQTNKVLNIPKDERNRPTSDGQPGEVEKIEQNGIKSQEASTGKTTPATDSAKKHYKAVVVGKSGAGKSTFINMVANLYNNRKYDDERLVAITQGFNLQAEDGGEIHKEVMKCNMKQFNHLQTDDVEAGQAKSQTQKCSEYTFDTEGYKLTLVDTPGIGDTRGVNQDKINGVMISDQVAKMGSFDAIILLYKGDDVRKDLSVTYILSELQSMMPKEFNSNLIVVFSHVSNPTSIPGIKHLQDMKIPTDKIVIMDNECYLSPDLIPKPTSEFAQDQATRLEIAGKAWAKNTKQYGRLLDFLDKIQGGITPLSGQKMNELREKKIALGEKTERIMFTQGNVLTMAKNIAEEEKELGYTRQDMITENSRIFVHMGKEKEVMVKVTVEEEVVEEKKLIVAKCSYCNKDCDWCLYSEEAMASVKNKLKEHQNQNGKCFFTNKDQCKHSLTYHELTTEKHHVKVKKPKEVLRKELQQVKEINITAKNKRDELLKNIFTMIKKLTTDRKTLRSLSAFILTLMKELTIEHRSIVSESMLPPSDPLETRLEREIMDLKDRADRNDPRAAEELDHMEALLRLYNEVKDEVDGKVKTEVPENEDRDGRSRNGNDRHHNGHIIHTAQDNIDDMSEGNTAIKQLNQSKVKFLQSSFHHSGHNQHDNKDRLYDAQYNPNRSACPTNQQSKIGLLDGKATYFFGNPIPQPAHQRAAPAYRPIENKYDGVQVNEALARANALMAADPGLLGPAHPPLNHHHQS